MKNSDNNLFTQPNNQNYWELTKPVGIHQLRANLPKQHIFSNLPYLTAECGIQIHSNLVRLKLGKSPKPDRTPPERKKNDITKFSANSRRRLIRELSQINFDRYSIPIFLTLTFHNVYPKDSEGLKKILRNYLKRIKRYDSRIAFVWRIEWQKRKAPHFHLILFPPADYYQSKINDFKKKLKIFWFKYLPDHSFYTWKYSVDVKQINEKKIVFSYISKYTAKIENESEMDFSGQRHGHSENLDLSPQEDFAVSQEFMIRLKKNFWKVLKKKIKSLEEFEKIFFDTGEISFMMDSDETVKILNATLRELSG